MRVKTVTTDGCGYHTSAAHVADMSVNFNFRIVVGFILELYLELQLELEPPVPKDLLKEVPTCTHNQTQKMTRYKG